MYNTSSKIKSSNFKWEEGTGRGIMKTVLRILSVDPQRKNESDRRVSLL